MNKEIHEELNKRLSQINKLLESDNLNHEEREKFEDLRAQIAGSLASSWLPVRATRKFILFIFLIFAFKYFMQSDYLLTFLMLVVASLFSPRAMGELVHFTGRIVGMIGRFFKFFN